MTQEANNQVEAIRERLEKAVQGKPYYFNPDPDVVESILSALKMRKDKFGEEYCPCRRVTGDKEQDASIICPCIYVEDEVAEQGHCHCRLFTGF